MRRTLHYLRIAVTALSLVACMLLIVLWVRSYRLVDIAGLRFPATQRFDVNSTDGRLIIYWNEVPNNLPGEFHVPTWRWKTDGTDNKHLYLHPRNTFGFLFQRVDATLILQIPHWFLVLLSALFAGTLLIWGLPRLKQFSLRTLLIATTLVAVGLGAVAYLAR